MDVWMTSVDSALTVHITGELDAVAVNHLRPMLEPIIEKAGSKLVVDIAGLKLIDSCGVGVLVYLFGRLRSSGRSFVVRGATDQPLFILRLMKLDQVLMNASVRAESRPA